MKAEVKCFCMVGQEWSAYWPEDVTDFHFAADATIGIKGGKGGDIFSFEVCTPKWFARERGTAASFMRHIIFVNEYDETQIQKLVVDLVENTIGQDWEEIARVLSRYMFWEFEDYENLK
ncbi:Imm8 family immunity protein [Pseudovibrio sp. SCP19]|uniref:Imm8 family immunity protein n=1 Tax=Pseudovibrio sp. SCP19 TaxID=3141374 RepID=UPI0033365D01